MPAKGAGLAILKWVTSFPANPAAGLPVVMGVICVSSISDGRPLALVDVRSITALRTGAVAVVAAQELAREDASSVGMIGCGLHGTWAARCLAAAEYGPGICFDPDPEAAGQLAGELGWEVGSREDALACDVVTCVTPGNEPVVHASDLRPGLHLNMLGADGPGKAEADVDVIARVELFCDEWEQASHGGELTGAVEAGLVKREQVTELGEVLTGSHRGRSAPDGVTLFDSTRVGDPGPRALPRAARIASSRACPRRVDPALAHPTTSDKRADAQTSPHPRSSCPSQHSSPSDAARTDRRRQERRSSFLPAW